MLKTERHPGKMVSPSLTWKANHLSGISASQLWIPDNNSRNPGFALGASNFRDDVTAVKEWYSRHG